MASILNNSPSTLSSPFYAQPQNFIRGLKYRNREISIGDRPNVKLRTYVSNSLTFVFRCSSPRSKRKRWSFIGHLSRGHLLFSAWQAVFTQFHIKVQSDCCRSPEKIESSRMPQCISFRWSFKEVSSYK